MMSCSRPTWVKRPSLTATALAVGGTVLRGEQAPMQDHFIGSFPG
jgi:hypothetical protein